jgi:hypothetical protein
MVFGALGISAAQMTVRKLLRFAQDFLSSRNFGIAVLGFKESSLSYSKTSRRANKRISNVTALETKA